MFSGDIVPFYLFGGHYIYNIYPIGSRYLLRMVLELKVLPKNGLGGSKDILRMVLDPRGILYIHI